MRNRDSFSFGARWLLSLLLHKAVLLAKMTDILNIKIKNKALCVKICLIPIYKTCKMP